MCDSRSCLDCLIYPPYSDCLIYPCVAFLFSPSSHPMVLLVCLISHCISSRQNVDLYSVPIFVNQSIVILHTTPFDSRFQFCLALVWGDMAQEVRSVIWQSEGCRFDPTLAVSKYPWARHLTPNCSWRAGWYLAWQAIAVGVWMFVWMRGINCTALWIKALYKCSPFTINHLSVTSKFWFLVIDLTLVFDYSLFAVCLHIWYPGFWLSLWINDVFCIHFGLHLVPYHRRNIYKLSVVRHSVVNASVWV